MAQAGSQWCKTRERDTLYRGTSLIRNRSPLGPYSRTIPRVIVVLGGGQFLMSEVPLYRGA
jgi:hypothetical protein